jgi:hypothetical protein
MPLHAAPGPPRPQQRTDSSPTARARDMATGTRGSKRKRSAQQSAEEEGHGDEEEAELVDCAAPEGSPWPLR